MKKLLHHIIRRNSGLVLAGLMAMVAVCASAAGDKVKVGNYYYYLDTENKTAEVAPTEDTTAYATGRLVIPSYITYNDENYSVTAVGDYAFSFCTGITTLTIPTSILRIGNGAFQGCSKINTVLFQVTKVEEIGDAAFEGCEKISSITIPATLKRLGAWAFAGCTALKVAAIPANITYIGKNAFMRCTSLTSANIKANISEIPDGIFDHCTSLTKVAVTDSILQKIDNVGIASFYDCPKLTSFTFGNAMTRIEPCAFMSCTGLGAVTLPESVTFIGHDAFSACQKMTSINIPDAVDSIGDHAFKGASALKSITMSDNVEYLGEQAFAYCTGLKSANLSSQITEVPFKTFAGCTSLTDFTLPSTVTAIADSAFQGTKCFDTLKLVNVTSIGDYAFADCGTLSYVYISDKATDFGQGVFANSTLNSFYVSWNSAPSASVSIFGQCDTLFVPQGKLAFYYNRSYWKNAKVKKMYDTETVGIADVKNATRDDDAYYTIDGIRVLAPEKGRLYIHGGKKIILQ